jgi:tRNA A-37 threonylcarbamoyl transferase component Bud32
VLPGANVLPGARDADVDPGSPDTSENAETIAAQASSSSSQLLAIILTVVGTTFVLLLLAVGYRKTRASMAKHGSEATSPTANYNSLNTPMASSIKDGEPSEPQPSSNEYLANDIRNDKLLAHFRIEGSAIEMGAPIARGGFGIIYTGVVHGERVAIKQMLPDTWRDEATVASFMDEIRMCVSLNHPKIVRCIGISWTSLRDLSVVTEYMDGGDLHSVLQTHSGGPTGREWSEPWTDANLKSKTSIASDVAEAVMYLHSFNTPIIHRDLKAQNVLLDSAGNAKLSDFGISREVAMDETMTREIGTMAWIAPEVLRGERYSEKADIYSLGVLLVEMDRCRHPYAHEEVMAKTATESNASGARGLKNETSQAIVKNTKIAILVSTGMLRPTPSSSCPERVRHVMTRCLAFDAAERPTAQEVVAVFGSMQPL